MPDKGWESGSYGLCIVFRNDDETSASHSGACDDDVDSLLSLPYMKEQFDRLDTDTIRKELAEYGAWDSDELADDKQNQARLLWIAAGDINDGNFYFVCERARETWCAEHLSFIPPGSSVCVSMGAE